MTIVLIRHAERHSSGADTLAPAGKLRAALLAKMFRDSGVGTIFVSEFVRTKETAEPLAALLGLAPVTVAVDTVAARAQILSAGPLAFVVGHSDSVPELIAALGGPDVVIDEHEFDRMFIVTVADGTVKTLALRYGA